MKKKEKQALKSKSTTELKNLIEGIEKELVTLQVELKSGKLKNSYQVLGKRRDLARAKTILRNRELQAAKPTIEGKGG